MAKLVLPIGGVYRELEIWVLTIWRGTDREFIIRGQLLGECRTRVRDTVAPDEMSVRSSQSGCSAMRRLRAHVRSPGRGLLTNRLLVVGPGRANLQTDD